MRIPHYRSWSRRRKLSAVTHTSTIRRSTR